MKPMLIQMVRVPIKGRVEVMTMQEVRTLHGELGELIYATTNETARIKRAVSAEFELQLGEIDLDQRTERLVWPRQVAYWLHRALTPMSYDAIGHEFRNEDGTPRHHGTIFYGCRRVEERMSADARTRARITALRAALQKQTDEVMA